MEIMPFSTGLFLTCGASVVGRAEAEGPLGPYFDEHDKTDRFGAGTWEIAEGELCRAVAGLLFRRAGVRKEEVDAVFSGDLQNQCVASAHGLLPFGIPYVGLYGACSTCTEGLLLASLAMTAEPAMRRAAVITTSHNCAAERQFRQPIEYGGQRAPTAQWTATAGGGLLLARSGSVRVRAGMIGRMVNGGITDPANMGAAMAPAAADTILRWFAASGEEPERYDAIVTGDLGREGRKLMLSLLSERGLDIAARHRDCGIMLYDPAKQDVHAGGSGCGCSAAVLAAYFLPHLVRGTLRRVLFLSTGALMSTASLQQGEPILGVAPAVCLEYAGE